MLTFPMSCGIIYHAVEYNSPRGGVAQLGERLNGIQEVIGSIPTVSTKKACFHKKTSLFPFLGYFFTG